MMPSLYPNDADGDALRRVAATGSDMAAPMLMEFPVVIATEELAKQFASLRSAKGYQVRLWKHEDDSEWDVICAVMMIATHSDVVRIQRELTALARPFGGYCDSWGTFGNNPDNIPVTG